MQRSPAPTNPYLLWTELARSSAEMLMASAQVINHRASRMALAGVAPDEQDQREFALMGQEKIDAASESSQAMAAHLLTMNHTLGTTALRQMLAGMNAMMSLLASPSAAQSIKRHAKLVHSMTESAQTASQISHSTAQLAQHGLRPLLSRAKKNALRLTKS